MSEIDLIISKMGHKINSLESEKKELLEALEKATDLLEVGYPDISVVKESKSLIQKHKQ